MISPPRGICTWLLRPHSKTEVVTLQQHTHSIPANCAMSSLDFINSSTYLADSVSFHSTTMPASFLASLRAWIASSTIGQRILLALALGLLLITARVISKSKGTMPPGPRGLPLLGNIFQLPKLPWYRFTEWKEEFGMSLLALPACSLSGHQVPSSP